MKAQRTTAAKKDSEKTQLERLIATAVAARKIIREFEEENADVLDKYKHLTDDLAGVNEKLKIEARKMAVLGSTKVIIDNRDVHVSVMGKQTRKFDVAKAHKFWDDSILDLAVVETIDGKIVDDLVEAGKLSEDDVKKVATIEAATAAVTIRLP